MGVGSQASHGRCLGGQFLRSSPLAASSSSSQQEVAGFTFLIFISTTETTGSNDGGVGLEDSISEQS
ncbi:unnamed protein product [Urochloa humidicola]